MEKKEISNLDNKNGLNEDYTIDKELIKQLNDHSFLTYSDEANKFLPPLKPEDQDFGYHIKRTTYTCTTTVGFCVAWIGLLCITIWLAVQYFNNYSEADYYGISVLVMLIIFLVWWVSGILIIGILNIKELKELAKKDVWFNSLKKFFKIGIFIPLVQLFAAIKVLAKIRKQYRRLIFYDYSSL